MYEIIAPVISLNPIYHHNDTYRVVGCPIAYRGQVLLSVLVQPILVRFHVLYRRKIRKIQGKEPFVS